MYTYLLLLVFSLLLPPQSIASDSPQLTVIHAARMLDVKSGEIVKNARVIIEQDRIKSMGATKVPRGTQTIELDDLTLLPGLIDTHTHLSKDLDKEAFNRIVKEGPADLPGGPLAFYYGRPL